MLVFAAAAPGAASAATSRCASLPVSLRLSTTDPTTLIDDSSVIAASKGRSVSGLQVWVMRGTRTVSAGSLPGVLTTRSTPVRLTTNGRPGQGAYRIVASGRARGCPASARASRPWTLGAPSLPVRAAPLETVLTGDTRSLRLRLRTVGDQKVAGVRAVLVDDAGAAVAQADHPDAFTGAVTVDLALPSDSSGSYTLQLSGMANDAPARTDWSGPLAVPPIDANSQPVTPPTPDGPGLTDRHVVVDWSGGAYDGRSTAGFDVPGIGYGEIVCRPDAQWIRVFPNNARDEVSMMNWTYRDWKQGSEKSLREALHTRGTGLDFREGLNKFAPAEKQVTGEFDGIISDRGTIGAPGRDGAAPPTTLRLTWVWDFRKTGNESCHVEADFSSQTVGTQTPLARSASIVWRGDRNAAGRDSAGVDIPNVGHLGLSCQAGADGSRLLTLDSPLGGSVTTREGSDDNLTAWASGPITAGLPNNGQISIILADGTTLLVSTRWKVNDPDGSQNFCAIAAQAVAH
jgi:hypothetical protein